MKNEEMKLKVLLDGEKAEIMTLEEFVKKFNNEEINSATDFIEIIKAV